MFIDPTKKIDFKSNIIKTNYDHRIAMAFTIAGYITSERNILDDKCCIDISFPEFNSILESILK